MLDDSLAPRRGINEAGRENLSHGSSPGLGNVDSPLP